MNFQQKLQNSLRLKSELEKEIEQAELSIKTFLDSKEYGHIHRKLDLIMANLAQLEFVDADIIYYREQADLELSQGSY
jgi:predicted ribosome quality control (RQC) complex YloA/Tae2 family protein